MNRTFRTIALLAAPLVLLGGAFAVDRLVLPPRGRPVVTLALPPSGGVIGLPPIRGPLDASRPLVVIDAGHGGHDPGAQNGRWHEKAITLGLAQAVRDALLAAGGVRVALTRDDDRYLALDERSGIARQLGADLFVSIHADSADGPGAATAAGGTVYTLSARGSSEEATRIARSENAADRVNGVVLQGNGGEVSAILVDLAQRQSGTRSRALADLILREGRGVLAFRPQPEQSAAFVVLKSPDVPSILFEAGYISNPEEAEKLMSPAGRKAFADVTARAIRIWLARQSLAEAGASPSPSALPVDEAAAPPAIPAPRIVPKPHPHPMAKPKPHAAAKPHAKPAAKPHAAPHAKPAHKPATRPHDAKPAHT